MHTQSLHLPIKSTTLSLFVLIVNLLSRCCRDSPMFLTHPTSSLPLCRRTRDRSLTNETRVIVRPFRPALGAASGLVNSEEFFNADVMQSTGTSHIRTSLALILS